MLLDTSSLTEPTRRCRLGGLGFDKRDAGRVFNDEISLGPVPVAVKRQTARLTAIGSVFRDLRDHPGLENRTAKRMGAKLFRRTNTKQPTDETGVVEVQLRHLHEPLTQVRVKRRQAESEEPVSRMLSQAFAVGCDTPQSPASDA